MLRVHASLGSASSFRGWGSQVRFNFDELEVSHRSTAAAGRVRLELEKSKDSGSLLSLLTYILWCTTRVPECVSWTNFSVFPTCLLRIFWRQKLCDSCPHVGNQALQHLTIWLVKASGAHPRFSTTLWNCECLVHGVFVLFVLTHYFADETKEYPSTKWYRWTQCHLWSSDLTFRHCLLVSAYAISFWEGIFSMTTAKGKWKPCNIYWIWAQALLLLSGVSVLCTSSSLTID